MRHLITPKLTKRRAAERGRADHGWLQAQFTFSFADYFDPDHMGFHAIRVMNNDTIQPGGGFPTHPHRDMEIFTYVVDGQLEHRDSMGNGAVIEAGDLQYMSAGSGVQHSEFNPSSTDTTTLYQIWLHPAESGGEPRYAEKPLGDQAADNALTLLFSGNGHDGSTQIRQNADIYFGRVGAGQSLTVPASESMPHVWIQVIAGDVTVLGESLGAGDGLAIEDAPETLGIEATRDSQLMVFGVSE